MNSLGRKLAAPLLFANLIMYFIVLGFASWCVNRYINGQSHHPSLGGNPATEFFLTFALLAAVLGIVSKFAGGTHLRFWRNDSLAAAGSLSMVAWAVTTLAFGFACKEINIGGYRGWRLRVLEGFIIVLAFTELFYLVFIHMGMFANRYGPGYRDTGYGVGAPSGEPEHKGGGVTATRVV